MVDDRTTDGVRIAQLLASELSGEIGRLAGVTVTDANPDVEPTTDGARAYSVRDGEVDGDERLLAEVFVHPDRVRVEFVAAPDVAANAGEDAGLRVRPKATEPPRTIVFVEDGAEAKRVVDVFDAVVRE
ncbi:hypothetical protein [Halobaculum sp. D14]|uniref:hypothetical protein n=1 Tax=unclassified Halobaculum TaxID=2640896 RepID=UPI003EBDCD7A